MKEKLKDAIIRALWNCLAGSSNMDRIKDDMVGAMKQYHTDYVFQKQCDQMLAECYSIIEPYLEDIET